MPFSIFFFGFRDLKKKLSHSKNTFFLRLSGSLDSFRIPTPIFFVFPPKFLHFYQNNLENTARYFSVFEWEQCAVLCQKVGTLRYRRQLGNIQLENDGTTVFFHIKNPPRFPISAKQKFFWIPICVSTPKFYFYLIPKCVHPSKFASRMTSPPPFLRYLFLKFGEKNDVFRH